MTKKILIFAMLFGFIVSAAYAQESITLTTYYPSPFGAYNRVRLQPQAPLATPCDPGTMYYDQNIDNVRVCIDDGTGTGIWDSPGAWYRDATNGYIYPIEVTTDKVGIGTQTPGEMLEIFSNSEDPTLKISSTDSSRVPTLELSAYAGDVVGTLKAYGSGVGFGTYLGGNGRVFIGTDVSATTLRIDSNRLGIGLAASGTGSSPQNTLDVKGNAVIGAGYSGTNAAPANGLLVEGNVGIGTNSPLAPLDVVGTEGDGEPSFVVRDSGGTNMARIYVDDWSGVGIGTDNPTADLEVTRGGTMGGSATLKVRSIALSGLANAQLTLESPSVIGKMMAYEDTSNAYMTLGSETNHSIRLFTNNTTRMTIDRNGNVGIGTTTPTHLFQAQLLGADDYIAFSDAGSGDFGLELRSPSTRGNPYIDFTNSSSVKDYDVRLQLDNNQMLDVTGGGLMVFGSRVCTQANPCVAPNHNHPAGDITGGGFGAAETPSAGSTYTVETLLKPGASGVIVANQIPSDTTPVPIYVNNIESAPELCIDIPGSCSTTQEWCIDEEVVMSQDWGSNENCLNNCSCEVIPPMCDYDCDGEVSSGCGTHVSYNGPCDFDNWFCDGSVCICNYSKIEQYIQGSYQSAGVRCIPFPN